MEMSGVSNRLLTAQVLLLWDTVTRDCRVRRAGPTVGSSTDRTARGRSPREKDCGRIGAKDSHFYGSRARRCLALDRSCRWREAARQTRS